MIHLDTNYLIRALVPGTPQAAQLDAWILANETIGVSAMAWTEFLCGPLTSAQAAAVEVWPIALSPPWRCDLEHRWQPKIALPSTTLQAPV